MLKGSQEGLSMARQKQFDCKVPTFTIDAPLLGRLDAFQELSGVPRALIMRRAIEFYLDSIEVKAKA